MTNLPLDPKALPPDAVRWLLGMGPDLDGYAFGENPDLGRGAFSWRRMVQRYLEAAPQPAAGDGWMPIETAKKDGSVIWAKFRPDIYPMLRPGRSDLEAWNGVEAPLRHPGVYEAGGQMYDHGWNVALPVGCGGLPDEWIAGWRPLPAPPESGA